MLCLAAASALGGGHPADAAAGAYTKYYVVAEGSLDNLVDIATQLLGQPTRASELFELNAGRRQPDGQVLSDSFSLRPGWIIVLPWDAFGNGVRFGELDAGTPGGDGTPGAATSGDWAQRAMGAERVWERTRGEGVMVAIVDSGVDAAAQQLSEHVAVGADIVAGSERGDRDPVGSGTAMAGVIVGGPSADGGVIGLAPGAVVMPMRVVDKAGPARSTDVATAIEVAVSAGASVIALGSYADLDERPVADAIASALAHDVVVVAGAKPGAAAANPANSRDATSSGLLTVGGVGPAGQLAAPYANAAVDVLAPGVEVTSVGGAGSGTQYAVAFVAGTAALVRAAHPRLTGAQVASRIKATAVASHVGKPDAVAGWGMIAPDRAVEAVLPAEAAEQSGDIPSSAILFAVAGLACLTLAVVGWRRGKPWQNRPAAVDQKTGDGPPERLDAHAGAVSGDLVDTV
ncbi:hypothetical protein Cci01nite_81870 [Catellatospora citrea]|uniref:Peptidase S8/S53 domain-containing protein n=1 Tax=Catellatospora citrea TaxID=53366 RepID=A0A8J3P479_9ACTN|nr:hypothetical protein Cci01nite_81870 [Catellatospora citrea]